MSNLQALTQYFRPIDGKNATVQRIGHVELPHSTLLDHFQRNVGVIVLVCHRVGHHNIPDGCLNIASEGVVRSSDEFFVAIHPILLAGSPLFGREKVFKHLVRHGLFRWFLEDELDCSELVLPNKLDTHPQPIRDFLLGLWRGGNI